MTTGFLPSPGLPHSLPTETLQAGGAAVGEDLYLLREVEGGAVLPGDCVHALERDDGNLGYY